MHILIKERVLVLRYLLHHLKHILEGLFEKRFLPLQNLLIHSDRYHAPP